MRNMYLVMCFLVMILLPSALLQADEETQSGRIAYIGTDHNAYVQDFSTNQVFTLTNNADDTRIYEMPTWATDGRLAYFSRERVDGSLITRAFVTRSAETGGDVVFEATNRLLNYAYWSPEDCDDGTHCRDLALLISDGTGLAVDLVRDRDEGASSGTIGQGNPFYWSWSPDGSQMFWQRNSQQLDIYDVSREILSALGETAGVFQSPAWSPVDDRLLFGASTGDLTDLTVYDDGETQTLAPDLEGLVAFGWSPDGRYVAYTAGQHALIVLDGATGELVTRTLEEGVFAFFWSPNSASLAYVTLASRQNSSSAKLQSNHGLTWSVIDVPSGQSRHFDAFFPTHDMLYVLSYFDQFAHSHQLWSPDSRYLVYSEATVEGESLIQMVDTSESGTEPETVASGLLGFWSFE